MGAVNFLLKYFWPLSQITSKYKRVSKTKLLKPNDDKALRKVPRNGKRPTQLTEIKKDLKRTNDR
jgi:hypothetical protein